MTFDWKVFLPIGIVVVLILVFGYYQYYQVGKTLGSIEKYLKNPISKKNLSPVVEEIEALPPATGNVDDAVDAVVMMVDNDLSLLDEELFDVSLLDFDSQAISDLGQSYNENEF